MERLELFIGKFMLISALICLAFVSIGGIFYLIQHGTESVPVFIYPPKQPLAFATISEIVLSAMKPLALGIVQLGLLMLLMVQLSRVLLTAWLFIKLRDRIFVFFSLFVLIILILSTFIEF